ncbi:head GIN domain-containing protein [Parasphingorhabdus flavimaris]|uniref:head GIN domain-containing protein n=1 Tax=Parasphingorhabdus flavimaris TaxID=266812 RepID=UPI003001B4BB|tara:strand:+ start:2243 stop:2986 length:744 start_codon:yes stop_codon:yes gene_type:complete
MKNIVFLAPLLALAACEGSIIDAVGDAASSTSSFTDGNPIGTSASDPGPFEGITLAGPDNIVFTTGTEFSIRAEGDSEAIEQLRYSISGGHIKIGREGKGMSSSDGGKATVFVSAPSLQSAKLAGSGDMEIDSMTSASTRLSIAGSGNIRVANIETDSLESKIAGSGDLDLAGSAESVDISIAGSGHISGKDLKAASASISVAGSGDVELSSDGSVDAKVMGSGDVRIHGNAKCKSRAMGSGDISCG